MTHNDTLDGEILDATKRLLEHRKRLKYGALKRQFDLDDARLEYLKTKIVQDPRFALDEAGERLVRTGGTETTPGWANEPMNIKGCMGRS